MRAECPNLQCVNHTHPPTGRGTWWRKNGRRKTKRGWVPRYQCCMSLTTWSGRTTTRRQKRPDLNRLILKLAVSGMTMRRMALVLECDRKTVARKIRSLAIRAWEVHQDRCPTTAHAMMDELETHLWVRWAQVSVAVVIRTKTHEILSIGAAEKPSSMPAGQANGWTKNNRPKMLADVFADAVRHMKPDGVISTDGATPYPKLIALHMSGVKHLQHVVDKSSTHDPLFAINHLFAQMRQDLARLFRSTWSHSKDLSALRAHLWLYVAWKNGYDLGRDVRG